MLARVDSWPTGTFVVLMGCEAIIVTIAVAMTGKPLSSWVGALIIAGGFGLAALEIRSLYRARDESEAHKRATLTQLADITQAQSLLLDAGSAQGGSLKARLLATAAGILALVSREPPPMIMMMRNWAFSPFEGDPLKKFYDGIRHEYFTSYAVRVNDLRDALKERGIGDDVLEGMPLSPSIAEIRTISERLAAIAETPQA